jgi:protein gp37
VGDKTKIAWCDATLSPWIGCMQCSPGCDRCYAKGIADRFYKDVTWGPDASKWRMVKTFHQRAMALERKAVRIGRPLFVFPSMCDPFYGPEGFENSFWRNVANETPHLVWLLLTKRPKRIDAGLWPRNVWLGVSVEFQAWADLRIPVLLRKPCAVRFVSVEPMLGPVDLWRMPLIADRGYGWANPLQGTHPDLCADGKRGPKIDWVICGGESGSGARMMEKIWVMELASQCASVGTPFWFKQWGAAHGRKMAHCDQLWGKQYHERPEVVL